MGILTFYIISAKISYIKHGGADMNRDVEKILISEAELDEITTRLAKQIDKDYAGEDKNLLLL